MAKYLPFILLFASYCYAQSNKLGINTHQPEALFDINHPTLSSGSDTGLIITSVNNFPSIDPNLEQNGMLVHYSGSNLNKGLYYWDHHELKWQYIFQNSTIKNNLAKVSYVSKSGFDVIPSGTDTEWRKTTFDIINTPSANFRINKDGNIVVGEDGNYNLYFTGGITQESPANNVTNCEISIVLVKNSTGNEIELRTAAIAIPAPDVAERSSNATVSLNAILEKNDVIVVKTKRKSSIATNTKASSNYVIILSKLSN